jgi:alcohol dehydrogenase
LGQFSYFVPTKIVFGVDSSNELAKECAAFSAKSVLLVTDMGVEKAGIADQIREKLSAVGSVESFNEVEPEPAMHVAEKAAGAARRAKYDLVVGVGGGSALDIAKLASLAGTNSGKISDRIKGIYNTDVFPNRGLPMIMLPTTAGTGSEVTPTSMLIADHSKVFIQGRHLFPDVAIIDPKLTLSMPAKVTVATGSDALTHAVEGFLSKGASPLTDGYAIEAVRLIAANLQRAYTNGTDLEARKAMSLAALLAGLVLRAGMIYGHSIAYTIATRYKLPHGISTAIPLPYIMEYNLPARQERLAAIGKAMGQHIGSLAEREAAVVGVRAVAKLLEAVGIPKSLRDLGADRDILKTLAGECVKTYPRPLSPRPMSEDVALKLYERMYDGKLLA